LTINVDHASGTGTYSDWDINLAGIPGEEDVETIYTTVAINLVSDTLVTDPMLQLTLWPNSTYEVRALVSWQALANLGGFKGGLIVDTPDSTITWGSTLASDLNLSGDAVSFPGGGGSNLLILHGVATSGANGAKLSVQVGQASTNTVPSTRNAGSLLFARRL
jgi:hypothetical protein